MLKSNLSATFAALHAHLFRSGITALGEMQPSLVLPNVKEAAAFRLGFDPGRNFIVTVMHCESDEAATRLEAETRAVPQVSCVSRKGPFVMACTFNLADPILERRFVAAFQSFQPDLRTTT